MSRAYYSTATANAQRVNQIFTPLPYLAALLVYHSQGTSLFAVCPVPIFQEPDDRISRSVGPQHPRSVQMPHYILHPHSISAIGNVLRHISIFCCLPLAG